MARSVGQVYVTVVANTQVFEEQVKRSARDAAEGAGTEIDARLTRSFRGAAQAWARDRDLRSTVEETGRQIARKFGIAFEEGLNDVSLTKQFSAVLEDYAEATESTLKDVFGKISPSLFAEYERELNAMQREAKAFSLEQDRLERSIAGTLDVQAERRRTNNLLIESQRSLTRSLAGVESARVSTMRDLNLEVGRLGVEIDKQLDETIRLSRAADRSIDIPLLRLRNSLRRAGTGGAFDTFTNLLAVLPGLASSLARLGRAVSGPLLRGLTGLFDGLSSLASSKGLDGLATFTKGIAAATAAAGPYVQAGVAIAGVFTALVFGMQAIGAAVSLVSAAVGVITALGSALTYAAGALAAFLPIGAALAGAAVTIGLGFKGVGDAIGKFTTALNETDPKERAEALDEYAEALGGLQPAARRAVQALEPVIKQFSTLRDVIQERLFAGLDEQIRSLQSTFDTLARGLEGFASSVNTSLTNALAPLKEPRFLADLRKTFEGLRPIVEDFGTVLGNSLAGLTGLIQALLPSGERLSGFFVDISTTFKEWTQSARGKNSIQDFMDKAFESAAKVKDIIVTVGETIGIAFGASYQTGGSFLDSILRQAEQFKAWLEERVADGSFQEWLDSAAQIASDLWDFIEKAAAAFAKFDNPSSRKFLGDIIDLAGDVISGLGDLAAFLDGPSWQGLGRVLIAPFLVFLDSLALLSDSGLPFFDQYGQKARDAAEAIRGVLEPPKPDFTWADVGLDKLSSLAAQGAITAQEMDFIVNERDSPVFPLELQNKLQSLKNQGLLTDEQLAAIVADRPLSTWTEAQIASLDRVTATATGTNAALAAVAGDKPLPVWMQSMVGRLAEVGTQATITQGKINAIPGDKQVRIGITETGYEVVYGKIKTLLDQNGKTVNITIRGTAAGTGPGGPLAPERAAAGMLATSPRIRLIGEAGPEAVIPLTRPLSQVDPSVREMAAILRGYRPSSGATINVYPQQADPVLVAEAVMNRMVAASR